MMLGHAAMLLAGLLLGAAVAQPQESEAKVWRAVGDLKLEVLGSSNPLDFSGIGAMGVAGRHGWALATKAGHIAFEQRGEPSRFLCASMALSSLTGGLPSKSEAPRLVQALRRGAYNMVRLHFVDAHLMSGRKNDFDFDPEQLDRLHYLMAQLKQAGIYWVVDGLTSDNAAYGDVRPHRYVKKHQAKLEVFTSEAGFQHWATLVERLWGRTNPYTGLAPLRDPAMLGVILVNEGSLGFLATTGGGRYHEALAPRFAEWLKQRYRDDGGLRKAWGAAAQAADALTSRVEPPRELRGRSPRDLDFARFVSELERSTFAAMDAHVRKLGFKGLTTAFDNWGFLQADITRSAAGWVDMHSYHALPSNHGEPGSSIEQTSVHSNVARYVRELTNARQWGKPFTVSEYGQPFWNQWRHESALLMPAVAAHQDWDALCQFAESPLQHDYGPTPHRRLQAIYPYGVGGDPIAKATERLAALLFLRGDVAVAKHRIRLHLDPERVLARSGGWEQVPESLSRLGLVSAVGLDFSAMPAKSQPGELSLDLTAARPAWLSQLESGLLKAGGEALLIEPAVLKERGLVGPANLTRVRDKRYQFDTEQLLLDSADRRITLVSPRTEAAVLQSGAAKLGFLEVQQTSGPALFALSSLDGKPLAESRRMLMFVLTDAQNTGMTFDDAQRKTLRKLGTHPPMLLTVQARLAFKGPLAARLRVWPLSLAGERRAVLPGQAGEASLQLQLDTAELPDGPALYYEVAVEGP